MSLAWTSLQNEDGAAAKPIRTGEARVAERIPICCPVNLSHENESDHCRRIIRGRVLDMSAAGALIEALDLDALEQRRSVHCGSM